MSPRDVVVVRAVIDAGPDDRVFDGLLLSGPLVILILAAVGRSTFTAGIAALYLVAFLAYVLYKGATRGAT